MKQQERNERMDGRQVSTVHEKSYELTDGLCLPGEREACTGEESSFTIPEYRFANWVDR
jgi:hypothetical protein